MSKICDKIRNKLPLGNTGTQKLESLLYDDRRWNQNLQMLLNDF